MPSVPLAVRSVTAVAEDPLRWNDLVLMLHTGYRDDEIIADAASRQLVDRIGPAQAEILRGLGAGDRLINYLQARQLYVAPPRTISTTPALPVVQSAPVAPPVASGNLDPGTKDRMVASLTKQIDSLDDSIRRYRTMSRNPRDQQSADQYIKSLEDSRDSLRRQKWQLEGR